MRLTSSSGGAPKRRLYSQDWIRTIKPVELTQPAAQSVPTGENLAHQPSKAVDVDDGLRECLRSFLRQVVSDAARDVPVLVSAREFLGVGAGLRVWGAIGVTFHRD